MAENPVPYKDPIRYETPDEWSDGGHLGYVGHASGVMPLFDLTDDEIEEYLEEVARKQGNPIGFAASCGGSPGNPGSDAD